MTPPKQDGNSAAISHKTEHLKPFQFQSGQSGNPKGRPVRKPITDALNAHLDEMDPRTKKLIARQIAEALVKQAKRGNVKAAALVLDRVEGKQVQEIEGEIAGKIEVVIHDVSKSQS